MSGSSFDCPNCGEPVEIAADGSDSAESACANCGTEFAAERVGKIDPTSSDPLAGGRIGGLDILERIGAGGIGIVYRAHDPNLDRQVAVKVIHPSRASDPDFVRSFIRQVISAAQLNHPNIASTHKIGRDEDLDLHYLVMEWLEGEPLEDRIRQGGPLPVDQALEIILQCVEGLGAAHRRSVLHGDVKPGNILVDTFGRVRITDFGLTTVESEAGPPGKVMGTPHYMAPERFEQASLDRSTDIYSLGVTFYYALSGALPHDGENAVQVIYSVLTGVARPLPELLPGLPVDLWRIIERMIARSREDRYSDLVQVRRDLLSLEAGAQLRPVTCAHCGAANPNARQFCHECGMDMAAARRAGELTAELFDAVRAGRPDKVIPLAERMLKLPPDTPLQFMWIQALKKRLAESDSDEGAGLKVPAEVREYLNLGRFDLAVSALSEKAVLDPLDPSGAEIVSETLRALQGELAGALLDLVERAMAEGDFSFAASRNDALLRVAPDDHPERPRIEAVRRRIDEFHTRQRAAQDPLIGRRLGHWMIEEHLGEGAFGQVYRGLNVRLRQPVAIKILKRQFVSNEKALSLFRREARSAACLDHPGIVRIFGLEFDEQSANHFLVLEFVDGEDLSTVLRRQPDSTLPPDFALFAIRSCAEALTAAHGAGIVHRDLKPGNIMVLPAGTLKVADFGLAREVESDPTTTLKGTPPYMSPEQWNSKEDHRTDIYALGVCMYHLLSGKFPYPGTGYQIAMKMMTDDPVDLLEVRRDLPAPVAEFTARMIAKDPGQRPQSMRRVVEEITALADSLAIDLDDVPERHRSVFAATASGGVPEPPADTMTLNGAEF